MSHLGENPVRTEMESMKGGKWFSSLWAHVFCWDPNILPPFYRRERERRRKPVTLALPRYLKKKIPQQSHCCLLVKVLELKKDHSQGGPKGKKKKVTLQTFPQTLSEKGSTSQLQNRYICGHGFSLATRQIQSLYMLHGWSTRSFGCLPSTWQYKAHKTSNPLSMYFSFTVHSHRLLSFLYLGIFSLLGHNVQEQW